MAAADEPDDAGLVWETQLGYERGWEAMPAFRGLAYTRTWHRADDKGERWAHISADHWPHGPEGASDHLGEASVHPSGGRRNLSVAVAVEGENAETPIAERAEEMLWVLAREVE